MVKTRKKRGKGIFKNRKGTISNYRVDDILSLSSFNKEFKDGATHTSVKAHGFDDTGKRINTSTELGVSFYGKQEAGLVKRMKKSKGTAIGGKRKTRKHKRKRKKRLEENKY